MVFFNLLGLYIFIRKFASRVFLLMMLVTSLSNAYSQRIINLNKEKSLIEPREEVAYIWDKEGYTFQEVLSDSLQKQFVYAGKKAISFGISDYNMWFRIKVKNSNPAEETNWIFELNYPHYDSLEVYFQDEKGEWQKYLTGDKIPFNTRRIFNKDFAFPFTFSDTTTRTFYFHIGGEGSRQFPLLVQSYDQFYADQERISVIYGGVFFGIIFIMLFYNLFIFFALKDQSYLWYVIFNSCVFIFYLGYSGYGFQYVWTNYPWINAKIIPLGVVLTGLTCTFFVRQFLNTKMYVPWIDRVFLFTMGLYVIEFILVWFLNYGQSLKMATGTAMLSASLILVTSYLVWIKGNKFARFMALAFSFYLIGIVLLTFNILGLLSRNFIVAHAMEIGSAIEITLLSLALSDKYSLLRKEKEKAQAEVIEVQRIANEELEKKVARRTLRINHQKTKLQELNKAKDRLLSIISHDLKGPLSSFQSLLSMMLRDELTKQNVEMYAMHLNNKLGNMVSLVDNILHWIRSQMDGIKFDIQPVKLKEIVKENVNLFSSQAMLKQIEIIDEVADDIEMMADKNVLRLVIRNLMANALKFTDSGGKIYVTAQEQEDSVQVEIKDTGVGMDREKVKKLFTNEHFTTPDTNQKEGTGLGLLLCKEFLSRTSGEIYVESEPGKGTSFKFTLPRAVEVVSN